MTIQIHGMMAALPTPRSTNGGVDLDAVERVASFALERGAQGVVPCGGTGEYFDIPLPARQAILERVLRVAGGRGVVIAGIGTASVWDSIRLAEHALGAGAAAVLLPPPHFFRYGDGELLQFYRQAARRIGGPILLYNLAAFVSPIAKDVAAELIESEPNIIGIKDSSGKLDILRRLTSDAIPAIRIQGHDVRLADSLREGLLDGAISGPASVVPELSASIFETFGNEEAFAASAGFYAEFIQRMEEFPYPWALKWVAERRGLGAAWLPFPLSREQEVAADRFRVGFDDWLDRFSAWHRGLD